MRSTSVILVRPSPALYTYDIWLIGARERQPDGMMTERRTAIDATRRSPCPRIRALLLEEGP
jgi:hypothetical protein